MSTRKIIQYAKYGLFTGLMLVALIFLNVTVQKNSEDQKPGKEVETKLNVALVNEDTPIKDKQGLVYHLGSSYVKGLERDESNNWTVTSRGAAENGLKDEKYQLMVIIPSNFSSKILDIDSLTTNQALVTYQVNANGNHQTEMAANRLGAEIVADLNGQLVNMYMASILENLYQAQQNVLALSDVQAINIGTYSSGVYDSALGFQDDFDPLLSIANSSLSANDSLLASLSQSHEARFNRPSTPPNSGGPSETPEPNSPPSQIGDHLSLTSDELSQRLEALLVATRENQRLLGSGPEGGQGNEGDLTTLTPNETGQESLIIGPVEDAEHLNYSQSIRRMEEEIDRLDAELKTMEEENQRQSDLVVQRLSEKIRAYYAKDKDAEITLREFLNKSGDRVNSKDLEAQAVAVQEVINQLPSLNPEDVRGDLNALSDKELTFVHATYAQTYYGDNYSPSSLGSELAQAKQKMTESLFQGGAGKGGQVTYHYYNGGAATDESGENPQEEATPAPSTEESQSSSPDPASPTGPEDTEPSNSSAPQEEAYTPMANIRRIDNPATSSAIVTVSAPEFLSVADIRVNGQSVNNGASVSLNEGANSILVDFTYKVVAQEPKAPQHITITVLSSEGTNVTQAMPVDLSPYRNEDYHQAVETYASLAQKVVDAYATADAVIKATSVLDASGQRWPSTAMLDQNISDLLEDLVKNSLTLAYGGEEPSSLTKLRETKTNLQKNLQALQGNNSQVALELEQILAQIEDLQAGRDGERPDPDRQTDPDSDRRGRLADLQEDTASLRSESEERLSNARGVNSTFQRFQSQVEKARQDSGQLSRSAEELMGQFNQELEDNGDFVEAFSKVFSNAYNNGVANEVLLDFLSRPVSEKAQSVQATANVYRPFTWIILIEILSLFIAYSFGTQTLIEKIKDRYRHSFLTQSDLVSVGLLLLVSLSAGLILGLVSARQLSINQSLLPPWIFLIMVLSAILTLGQYLMIKNLRIFGMGLSLLMLVSYIYISNAIGRAVSASGGLGLIKRTNFLSFVEGLFSNFFNEQMVGLASFLALLLLAISLTLVNIFVPNLKAMLSKGR